MKPLRDPHKPLKPGKPGPAHIILSPHDLLLQILGHVHCYFEGLAGIQHEDVDLRGIAGAVLEVREQPVRGGSLLGVGGLGGVGLEELLAVVHEEGVGFGSD
jgi:hypothetical protein